MCVCVCLYVIREIGLKAIVERIISKLEEHRTNEGIKSPESMACSGKSRLQL